jgi:hypothetical protein
MKKFLLLMREDMKAMQSLSAEQGRELVEAHMAWAKQLVEKGHFLGGDGIEMTGKLIVGNGCELQDGPFVENDYIVGGYYLLQAGSMDELLEIAKDCPCHLWGGTTEIRPIMDY